MDELPRRLAELLESIATKVRAMTVDRIAKVVTMTSLGIPMAAFAFLALLFLAVTIYRALAIPLTPAGAYGVLAGLFGIGGALLWRKRSSDPEV